MNNRKTQVIMLHKKHPIVLTELFKGCLKYRMFPDRWKIGQLALIPKGKGRNDEVESYRPLTLLPAIGKVLEKCILKRTEKKNEENIGRKQYGFRKGKSSEDCILRVVYNLEKMRNFSNIVEQSVLISKERLIIQSGAA